MSIPGLCVIGNGILIALGANLPGPHGSPEQTLEAAKRVLERQVCILRTSQTWLTSPVPPSNQPWYRNAVIGIETNLPPMDLWTLLKDIELQFGRTAGKKNDARVLDLDLIAYNDEIMKTENLILPHPRMHERGFVLIPLQEVAPNWIHPVLKESVVQLIASLPKDQVATPLEKA